MNNYGRFLVLLSLSVVFNTVYSYVSLFPENVTALKFTRNISNECLNQLNNLTSDPTMLFKMIDSSTKIPDGILEGVMWDLGDFDECYNLESTTNEIIYGKYCLGSPSLSANTDIKSLLTQFRVRSAPRDLDLNFHWAICVPHQCSPEEVAAIPNFKEQYCYSKNSAPQLTTGAIITIVVLLVFLLISICSTIFDLVLYYLDKKPLHELLIAFSMLTNGRKLFNSSTNPDQLLCLNGIKAMSMMWVILGHTFALATHAPVINMMDAVQFEEDVWNMYLFDATISVDTFFTVGGLVTVYAFLKAMDNGVKFNIILYYIHRLLRLIPALGICILVYANLLKYLDNGPLWGEVEATLSDNCITNWWATILFIMNYTGNPCIEPTWYLSVDMQLFLLSPVVLLPLRRFEKIGVYFLGFLCLLGVIVPFCVGYGYEIDATIEAMGNRNYMSIYYVQTHSRFGPYVIGMLFGYLLYKIKKHQLKMRLHPILVCGSWLATIAAMIACLYVPYHTMHTYDRLSHSLLLGFQRQSWSLLVCIVISLCVSGYGGPINKFLSLSAFQLLAKLSYSIYLIHYAVVYLQYFRLKTLIHFSSYDMMFIFWGNFMLTLALSIFLCLIFESPIIIIEKYLFGRGKKEKTKATEP